MANLGFAFTATGLLGVFLASSTQGFVSQSPPTQRVLPLHAVVPYKPTNPKLHSKIGPLHAASIGLQKYSSSSSTAGFYPWTFSNHTYESFAPFGVDYGFWAPPAEPARAKIPSMKEIASSGVELYMQALHNRPLFTKAVSGAAVQMLGDLISQNLCAYVTGKALVYNLARTLCFGFVGFFYKAPMLSFWYRFTSMFGAKLQKRLSLTDNGRVAAELALDQSVGVLAFYPAYFYVYEFFSAILSGRAFAFPAFTAAGFSPIFSAMCANYAFWPLSQWLSFRFVPQQLRVLHTNVASILWNIFFCAIVAKR